jgi:hypothetical protein
MSPLIVSSCGEVGFKRGAGPDAFAAARTACHDQNADPAAMRTCLSQNNWNVTDLDSAPVAAAVGLPAPNADIETARKPMPGTPLAETPSASPAPAGKMAVGSWWKFGAGASDLHAAADACLAGLAPADKPDPGYHLVTRSLYMCLGAHGWHGIGSGAS